MPVQTRSSGGLACTAGPDQGHALAGHDGEVDAVERGVPVVDDPHAAEDSTAPPPVADAVIR